MPRAGRQILRVVVALLVVGALGTVAGLSQMVSCRGPTFVERWNELRGDPYPLDGIDRELLADAGIQCPELPLVVHRGSALRYEPAVKIAPAFGERLDQLEQVAAVVGTRVYGRPPRTLQNAGVYSCRAVRHRQERLSEHALGNAIDVVGFGFGPVEPTDAGVVELAPNRRRAFRVQLVDAWRNGADDADRRFVKELVDELARRKVFRAMLGPAHEPHARAGHFHFDCGPWPVIQI